MQKLMVTLLVGIIALAPAIAAAQTSSGGGSSSSGSSTPSGTKGSTGGGSTSSGSGTTPSASPSGTDMSKYTTKADCEKAGGKWQASSKMCMKK